MADERHIFGYSTALWQLKKQLWTPATPPPLHDTICPSLPNVIKALRLFIKYHLSIQFNFWMVLARFSLIRSCLVHLKRPSGINRKNTKMHVFVYFFQNVPGIRNIKKRRSFLLVSYCRMIELSIEEEWEPPVKIRLVLKGAYANEKWR